MPTRRVNSGGCVEASHDSVDSEALLVPIVGGGEEGPVASVGVELGHHARRVGW